MIELFTNINNLIIIGGATVTLAIVFIIFACCRISTMDNDDKYEERDL